MIMPMPLVLLNSLAFPQRSQPWLVKAKATVKIKKAFLHREMPLENN